MPLVIKSNQGFEASFRRSVQVTFNLKRWENVDVFQPTKCVWFTGEESGGYGLYALGEIISEGVVNQDKLTFEAKFNRFEPTIEINNITFKGLDKKATVTPEEKLNQLLYIHSHNKVAEIDDETYEFLASKFK